MGATGAALSADLGEPYELPPAAPFYYDVEEVGGFYIRADGGWSLLHWNGGRNDSALTAGGGIGYQFDEIFRIDVTGDYSGRYNIGNGAKMKTVSALGNAYVGYPAFGPLSPYIGAGAGWGWVKRSPGGWDDGFTFALMGGVEFDLTEMVLLDVGYRYRNTLVSGPNVRDHSIRGGLRIDF